MAFGDRSCPSHRKDHMHTSNKPSRNSALTEFLRSRGISAQQIIRRHAQRVEDEARQQPQQEQQQQQQQQQQRQLPPSAAPAGLSRRVTTRSAVAVESVPVTEPASSSSSKNPKKRKKKASSDDEDDLDWESKPHKSKPVPGQISFCEECNCRFTVTPYSKPSADGEGLLCNTCGKKTASLEKEAKKKKYTVRKNRRHANSALLDGETLGVKSLTDLCIKVVAKHIHDVEALGDIGTQNMDKICQIISRNRSLDSHTMKLFLDPGSTKLSLYDCSKIEANELRSIAAIVPTLRYLKLNFCGSITDDVISYYSTQLTELRGLSLGGPFLITKSCFINFLEHRGAKLEAFELTDTFRFDADCILALSDYCSQTLAELRLRTVTKIDNDCLILLTGLSNLKILEISEPELDITDENMVKLLNVIGSGLKELNLNRCSLLTDKTIEAIKACCPNLVTLSLEELELVTDKGIASLFDNWNINPGLHNVNFSRIVNLTERGVLAMLKHSGNTLEILNLNGCKIETAVWDHLKNDRGNYEMPRLISLDIGFIRTVNDEVVEMLLGTDGMKALTPSLMQMKVWGNHRVTEVVRCPDKFRLVGREADLH